MPFGSVRLIPGVNVEKTPTLLEAAISSSQLVRYRDGLVQKLGGWTTYFNGVTGKVRDLHAWQDLNGTTHVASGTVGTTQLGVITAGSIIDITPQTFSSNISTANFSQDVAGDGTIDITDPNITHLTTNDVVFFNTPVEVNTINILTGAYQITTATVTSVYSINPQQFLNASGGTGVVPTFNTTSGSSIVRVTLSHTNAQVGGKAHFFVSTTGNGVTIFGDYTILSVAANGNNFTIAVNGVANATGGFLMNNNQANVTYYLGQNADGVGQTGSNIVATDWTQDNWGQILLSCPANGGVYQYDPTSGNKQAFLVSTAPIFNGGIFVSQNQEILVCWASTPTAPAWSVQAGSNVIPRQFPFGPAQDPLLVRWSDVGDFTAFLPSATNQAGSFRIPTGSKCVAGAAIANVNLIWTDLDLWAMNYIGFPLVFGFNKIGAGAGAVSSHAVQQLRGGIYWMGPSNFFSAAAGGSVSVVPCPVWDFVFQNINTASLGSVRSLPNTPFNEVGWAFPSSATNGTTAECDSYVKFNITEQGEPWDFGTLSRSAWTDQSVVGMPLGSQGTTIFQHETAFDNGANAMVSTFTTNYFMIAEGEDFAFVDQIIPDMKWGFYPGSGAAQVQLSFNVLDYPGDTPTTFGPFTVTQTTEWIDVHFRGRQMSITLTSSDSGSFWRLGRIRYRWQAVGRR